jgi:hypothetical protein
MTPINWATIKKVSDIDKVPDNEMFDEYRSYAGGDILNIREDLPEDDIEAAFQWLTCIPEMWGFGLVIGEPGAGKTMFAHAASFDGKYLFGKVAILDKYPRKEYGRYIPFSTDMLKEQLARIEDVVSGNGKITKDGKWVSSRGEVFIRNSVISLDEAGSEHMSRLDSPMIEPKKTILKLLPLRRHLQALFLMVGTELNDFDRHCFPHVDYMIQCTRVDPPPYDPEGSVINIVARIQKVKYRSDRDEFYPVGTPSIIALDGAMPRDYLHGLAYKDLFHTDSAQAITPSKRMRIEK